MAPPNSPRSLDEPLRFERICLEKVWGGRRLERRPGIRLPSGPIGETWELVDRADRVSIVAEGAHAGASLRDLMLAHGPSILGRSRAGSGGRFPLIVKFLDAREALSVQVHPKSGTRENGHEGKDEAWYVLDAAADSKLWLGMRAGVHREDLARSAARRDVLAQLLEWPVRAGDWAMVPGGTVHAIGGGISLFEVQENSDTTHRLYDWDRAGLDGKPRPMQIEDALAATNYQASAPGPRSARFEAHGKIRRAPLAACKAFAMDIFEIEEPLDMETGSLARLVVALEGAGELRFGANAISSANLAPGDTWLVPASLGAYRVLPRDRSLSFMHVTVNP